MTRSLLVAALLLAAPLAAAQTAPADPWPLVPGNTWTYVVTSSYFYLYGGGGSDPLQTVTWTVLDSVETASGSGLAAGVYSVRLAAGDARTAVRVSVVR